MARPLRALYNEQPRHHASATPLTTLPPASTSHDMSDDQKPDQPKSKSRIKREMLALQELGEKLVELGPAELARIEIPDELRDAVTEARAIRQRGAHKRQLQYIGRLMRRIDPQPVRAELDKLLNRDRSGIAAHHRAERWRDRLLSEGDAALYELLQEHPSLDRQHLRQMMRNALREQQREKPPRAARELFRYLRDHLATPEGP